MRQRRRALASEIALIVVEGSSDRRALYPFLHPKTVVVAANGNYHVVSAFDGLETDVRKGILFILDCDGTVDERLKGHRELVITTNRDIEADLLFELDGLTRVAYSVLGGAVSREEIDTQVRDLLRFARQLTSTIGLIQTSARSLGLRVRVASRSSGQRRPLRLRDVRDIPQWAARLYRPSILEAAKAIANSTGWSEEDVEAVAGRAVELRESICKPHSRSACASCRYMTHCNGHYLVEAISLALTQHHSVRISAEELDRSVRIAADPRRLGDWQVVRRIQAWEEGQACRALRNSGS